MGKFKNFLLETKVRFYDDIIKKTKSEYPKYGGYTFTPYDVSYLSKYNIPRVKISVHFKEQAESRKLNEIEFGFILDQILNLEPEMRINSKHMEQFYMFKSKKYNRAFLVNYIKSENRMILWTVLPVGKEGTDDFPNTQKIYLEKRQKHDIIIVEIE